MSAIRIDAIVDTLMDRVKAELVKVDQSFYQDLEFTPILHGQTRFTAVVWNENAVVFHPELNSSYGRGTCTMQVMVMGQQRRIVARIGADLMEAVELMPEQIFRYESNAQGEEYFGHLAPDKRPAYELERVQLTGFDIMRDPSMDDWRMRISLSLKVGEV